VKQARLKSYRGHNAAAVSKAKRRTNLIGIASRRVGHVVRANASQPAAETATAVAATVLVRALNIAAYQSINHPSIHPSIHQSSTARELSQDEIS
jgi:hypothetical protein